MSKLTDTLPGGNHRASELAQFFDLDFHDIAILSRMYSPFSKAPTRGPRPTAPPFCSGKVTISIYHSSIRALPSSDNVSDKLQGTLNEIHEHNTLCCHPLRGSWKTSFFLT